VYPALLPLMRTSQLPVVDWTDAPADLNRFVRFAERQNQFSACVPSHFKRSLQIHSLLTSALVMDIVQLYAPAALSRGNVCRYSMNTRLLDPLYLPRWGGDIFLGEDGGNLPASLQAKYYSVGGVEGFTVVWLRTSAVADYDMSITGYPRLGVISQKDADLISVVVRKLYM